MPGKTQITIVGNTGSNPELRYTPNGTAVANFSVAVTPRWFDKNSNQWQDGDTTWYRVNAWNQLGANVSETITKGTRVIVFGSLENRSYEDQDGNTRYSLEINADAIGPDLAFASARVTKSERSSEPEPEPADEVGSRRNTKQPAAKANTSSRSSSTPPRRSTGQYR